MTEKKRTGFALLPPEARRYWASVGGKASNSRRWTSEEARVAGSKGGQSIASRGKEYMAEIGARGGKASQAARKARLESCPFPPLPFKTTIDHVEGSGGPRNEGPFLTPPEPSDTLPLLPSFPPSIPPSIDDLDQW